MTFGKGEGMNLTKLERLLLINQFEILKTIKEENQEYYEQMIDILTNGFSIYYSELESGLFDEMPAGDGRFVLDVLDLYHAIEDFKRRNEAKAINEHAFGYFPGFDGNEEGEYLGFVRFIIDKKKLFEEQEQYRTKTDDFNSHSRTLPRFSEMVARWERLGKKFELTEPEILNILGS
jgi:uncharacterized protein YfbU (UPF0304 family)